MNYLAHLYLAGDEPDALVGNLMGDFVHGRLDALDHLPPGVLRGVALHRRVDGYTDRHPVVRCSRGRIRPRLRRYAGILIDVFYDHFLARDWARYSAVSLDAFASRAYAILDARAAQLPPRMRRSVRYMRRHDLLGSYRDLDGVRRALAGIEGRLSRPSGLGEGIDDLVRCYDALARDFGGFFPELVRFSRGQGPSESAAAGQGRTGAANPPA